MSKAKVTITRINNSIEFRGYISKIEEEVGLQSIQSVPFEFVDANEDFKDVKATLSLSLAYFIKRFSVLHDILCNSDNSEYQRMCLDYLSHAKFSLEAGYPYYIGDKEYSKIEISDIDPTSIDFKEWVKIIKQYPIMHTNLKEYKKRYLTLAQALTEIYQLTNVVDDIKKIDYSTKEEDTKITYQHKDILFYRHQAAITSHILNETKQEKNKYTNYIFQEATPVEFQEILLYKTNNYSSAERWFKYVIFVNKLNNYSLNSIVDSLYLHFFPGCDISNLSATAKLYEIKKILSYYKTKTVVVQEWSEITLATFEPLLNILLNVNFVFIKENVLLAEIIDL